MVEEETLAKNKSWPSTERELATWDKLYYAASMLVQPKMRPAVRPPRGGVVAAPSMQLMHEMSIAEQLAASDLDTTVAPSGTPIQSLPEEDEKQHRSAQSRSKIGAGPSLKPLNVSGGRRLDPLSMQNSPRSPHEHNMLLGSPCSPSARGLSTTSLTSPLRPSPPSKRLTKLARDQAAERTVRVISRTVVLLVPHA